jgi:uncharacterized protein (TIGR00369 family)
MVDFDVLKRGFAQAPIVRSLGLELLEAEGGRACVRLPFREDLQQGLGLIHGGVLTLVADTACWFAVSSQRDDAFPASVELKINFLRPARRTALTASAEVVQSGRRVAVARFEVTNDQGELLAIGLSTLMTSDFSHVGIPPDALEGGDQDAKPKV